jgi:mannose-6-phosphate isomerase-like protein (cupin superfamily)
MITNGIGCRTADDRVDERRWEADVTHTVIRPGEGLHYDWTKDHIVVKTGLGITEGRVTVVEDTLKPGFHLPRHHHRRTVEIFYVLDGELTFIFDDETVVATVGTTVNVPTGVWHEVSSPDGAKLITVFTPGGFDQYMAELAAMTEQQLADAAVVTTLGETYDTWFG